MSRVLGRRWSFFLVDIGSADTGGVPGEAHVVLSRPAQCGLRWVQSQVGGLGGGNARECQAAGWCDKNMVLCAYRRANVWGAWDPLAKEARQLIRDMGRRLAMPSALGTTTHVHSDETTWGMLVM